MIRNKNGFTLLEIIIAIIMVGVLASLAAMNYGVILEKARAREGQQMLTAIFTNIQRVKVEKGSVLDAIVAGSDPFVNELPALHNFQPVNIIVNAGIPSINYAIVRNPPNPYTLSMTVLNTTLTPVVTCTGGPAGLCAKLGY